MAILLDTFYEYAIKLNQIFPRSWDIAILKYALLPAMQIFEEPSPRVEEHSVRWIASVYSVSLISFDGDPNLLAQLEK